VGGRSSGFEASVEEGCEGDARVKGGTLHSGKGGPVVKSRKQAIAIAMSEANMVKKKAKKKK